MSVAESTAVLVGAVAVAAAVVLPMTKRPKTRKRTTRVGRGVLTALAARAEPWVAPGFAAFAEAVARGESGFNNEAVNPADAPYACKLWENNRAKRYKNNPFGERWWCWGSGGWFGFLPATALAAPGFHDSSPMLVFSPEASIALLADFVRRIPLSDLPPEHRNWLAVRRFMAGNIVGFDWQEQRVLQSDKKDGVPRAKKVRARLAGDYAANGKPWSSMLDLVGDMPNYPGATQLFGILRKIRRGIAA